MMLAIIFMVKVSDYVSFICYAGEQEIFTSGSEGILIRTFVVLLKAFDSTSN